MFAKKKTSEPSPLDLVITQALHDMQSLNVESPEYAKAMGHVAVLMELQEKLQSRRRFSPDVILTVIANLAGILLILNYEHLHVMSSKAIGFVMKLR